jgi:branched-subunit amino acid permease
MQSQPTSGKQDALRALTAIRHWATATITHSLRISTGATYGRPRAITAAFHIGFDDNRFLRPKETGARTALLYSDK